VFRFLTSGESHGRAIGVIIEGVPAGLPIAPADLDRDLRRRQLGYGRGQRMAIERDSAGILSGVRHGVTIGSPIALQIQNRDWTNWQHTMRLASAPGPEDTGARRAAVTRPRPGHADLSAGLKYGREDLRDVLERASARETAARVAAGAIAKALLRQVGIDMASHVIELGGIRADAPHDAPFAAIAALADDDPIRCVDQAAAASMMASIDRAREAGDTVGGAFEVVAHRVPVGLGSHTQWDRKIDGRLAQALMSIPAIKAVGFGVATDVGRRLGSQVHDEIVLADAASGTVPRLARPTNRAGGVEGGVTNGEDVRITAWMKPISTLMKPLGSVDLHTMTTSPATIERSDVCAVPAAAVVGEAMVALILAEALIEKFGGDTLDELLGAWRRYVSALEARLTPGSR